MQTENPNPQNEMCERCGVVHTQAPVDIDKVAGEALGVLLETENAEWRKMIDLTPGTFVAEGIIDKMRLMNLGIDPEFIAMYGGDSMAGEALRITAERTDALRERYRIKPHQAEVLKRLANQFSDEISHYPPIDPTSVYAAGITGRQMPMSMAVNPRHRPQIVAGVSEGIFPIRDFPYQGITRGPRMSYRGGNLSQIPKTPEAQKLFRERMADGEYIPKAGSDARIMFTVDSFSPMDTTRLFIHEAYHAETYLENQFARARRCGKTRMNMALHEYESKHANHAFYDGEPGRPKADKAKRKAQKAARKRNNKCKK